MYNFESEIDAIDGMVREKEYMSNVSDIGKDLEHCKELQHKLSEANTDMTVNQKIQKAKQVNLIFFLPFGTCFDDYDSRVKRIMNFLNENCHV